MLPLAPNPDHTPGGRSDPELDVVCQSALQANVVSATPEVRALRHALEGDETIVTTGLILQELFQGFAGPQADKTQSITLSALMRSDCGILSPSALAVLPLMSMSNFIDCSTGKSLGLAPLSILATKTEI